MHMKIRCHGAGQEVGRSCFVVDYGEKVLLDDGVKLTPEDTEYPLPVKSNLLAAVISHAHLDHSGNLPHLYSTADTMAYMTPPTMSIAKVLWFDTLKIAGLEGMDAHFSKQEISRTERYAFNVNYRKHLQLNEETFLEFFDAGHILGSAITKLEIKDKTLVYTGDFKYEETRLHNACDLPKGKVDCLMIESTYGDREHTPRKETEKLFVESVQATLDRGGHVLVPAFAVGRSQEIVDILYEYKIDAEIYLDGMAQKVAKIMLENRSYLRDSKKLKAALDKVHWVTKPAMRKKAIREPSVIIATAGMLQGGAIYAYIPDLYKDKKSSMFLTGYQVKDTPGAILQKTGKIAIEGKMVDLKMELKKFDFSAHASRSELFTTVRKLNPKKVVCVHGDPEVAAVFVKDLKKEGFDAVAPRVGEEVIV